MSPKKPWQTRRELVPITDLAPKREITGGSQRRVFGTEPLNRERGPVAKKRAKDVPVKGFKKGG